MSITLKNKKIIISAGGSGIGWSSAKIFLDKGAIVYLCDINPTFLNKCKKHKLNNKKLFVFQCDASDENQVKNFFIKILNIRCLESLSCAVGQLSLSHI